MLAKVEEHIIGKDKVDSSNLIDSSILKVLVNDVLKPFVRTFILF